MKFRKFTVNKTSQLPSADHPSETRRLTIKIDGLFDGGETFEDALSLIIRALTDSQAKVCYDDEDGFCEFSFGEDEQPPKQDERTPKQIYQPLVTFREFL